MNQTKKGTILTLIAGFSWGISGISGEYLMANGVHVNLLTSIRLLIAGIFLTILAYYRDKKTLAVLLSSKKNILGIILFTLFGLVLNQYAYLSAIHHTNAGTATVLQYATPVLVLLYTCLRNRIWPSLTEVVAIVLAIGGVFIMATHGNPSELAITPAGLFWGILSAFTYAAYLLLPVQLIRTYGSLHVISLSMLLGGILFPLVSQAWTYSFDMTGENLLALFGIVGIGTIFAYTVFLHGVSIVGAVKGSLLASVEPVASVLLTVLVMGTQFYLTDFIGMVLIIAAVLLISLRDLLASQKAHLGEK
ncbi:DMT family transporter [Streptococcus sp.]|uniref:DMT family transporter n=1 Tax=Streptococcus sp. TaxID=1306 RepID=UPI0035A13C01